MQEQQSARQREVALSKLFRRKCDVLSSKQMSMVKATAAVKAAEDSLDRAKAIEHETSGELVTLNAELEDLSTPTLHSRVFS